MEESRIRDIVEKHFANTDKFVVSLKLFPDGRIELYIDGDDTVSLDDCVALSNFIESQLNRDEEDYELMVSSAGLSNPISLPRQYKKYIGKKIDILKKDGNKTRCILKEVTDDGIVVDEISAKKKKKGTPDKDEISGEKFFSYGDYINAKLVLDY